MTVTIAKAGERATIEAIVEAAPSRINGDDAAVLIHPSPNSRVVASTDMLIEGRHFHRHWSTAFEIGQKAITANFADIEAMGARPQAALLALSAPPETPLKWVRELASGMQERLTAFSAELVGGDVARSEQVVVSVTAIGSLGGNLPALTLDGARVGQMVVAHGKIGYSGAGFDMLEHYGRGNVPERFLPLVDAHVAPKLTPGRGMIARATGATAMTDISDGLAYDVLMMASRSGVSIDLNGRAIAPDDLLLDAAKDLGIDPWKWVLAGGEDHTLVATTSAGAPSGFRPIGKVNKGVGVGIDREAPPYPEGWQGF